MGKKKQEIMKLCISCETEKNTEKYFYLSNSKFHKDGRFPVCKDCIKKEVDINNIESIKNILFQMNRPFMKHLWESSVAESERKGKDLFGVYYKNVMLNHKHLTWNDGDVDKEKTENIIQIDENDLKIIEPIDDNFNLTNDIINFWGSGYTKEQYKKLQEFKEDMEMSYEIETASHKDYLKKICIVSLKMEEALVSGNIEHFKKLSDAYDKLMHSAKFTAVQRSAADRTGGMNTFSEFCEFAEKHGFIPKFPTDIPQDIVDQTEKNLMNFTKNLIMGDPNIANIVETALQKMNEKEEINDNEDEYDLEEDDYYES